MNKKQVILAIFYYIASLVAISIWLSYNATPQLGWIEVFKTLFLVIGGIILLVAACIGALELFERIGD